MGAWRRAGGRGPGRRYTSAERAELLAAYESSGLTQRESCAQLGVSTATLNTWRSAARQGSTPIRAQERKPSG
jgi:transposase-like protein